MFNILQQNVRPPWAVALDRAAKEFDQVQPLDKEKLAEMAAWLLIEQVYHDLRLDGISLARERVGALLVRQVAATEPEERLAVQYAEAIQRLSQIVSSVDHQPEEANVEITVGMLRELHGLAVGESDESAGKLRQVEINPLYPRHHPAKPYEVPRLLEIALDWFSAESIRELHPVEQAALAHLRLSDLQPFGKVSGRLTRLAASLYTMRCGLPPLIIWAEESDAYYQALLIGFQMATQPLVELFARCLGQTLRQMCEIAEGETEEVEGEE